MRILVPQGLRYTCRYDDRTGDELPVPLGTTAFVSGRTMFDILPRALQSVAVRTRVRYAPHSYVWMAPAAAHSTGLAIESEGKELALSSLPPWTEDKVKVFPMVRAPFEASCPVNPIEFFLSRPLQTWKNPVTGALHLQVHPCAVRELLIDPLPEGASRDGALYPDDARVTDLKEVRDLLYKMQRPAIAPNVRSSCS
jgi:xanthine dioxygenase